MRRDRIVPEVKRAGARFTFQICEDMRNDPRFVRFRKANPAEKSKLYCELLQRYDKLEKKGDDACVFMRIQ